MRLHCFSGIAAQAEVGPAPPRRAAILGLLRNSIRNTDAKILLVLQKEDILCVALRCVDADDLRVTGVGQGIVFVTV